MGTGQGSMGITPQDLLGQGSDHYTKEFKIP